MVYIHSIYISAPHEVHVSAVDIHVLTPPDEEHHLVVDRQDHE